MSLWAGELNPEVCSSLWTKVIFLHLDTFSSCLVFPSRTKLGFYISCHTLSPPGSHNICSNIYLQDPGFSMLQQEDAIEIIIGNITLLPMPCPDQTLLINCCTLPHSSDQDTALWTITKWSASAQLALFPTFWMPRMLSGRSVLNKPAEFHHKVITGTGDAFNDVGSIALFLLRKQTLLKCRTRNKVFTNNLFC